MAILFTVADPLGRIITLTARRWREHIDVEHPGLDYQWIVHCLESPDFIAHDAAHKRRRVFYRRRFLPGRLSRFFLKVVVELPANQSELGRVVTAYIASEAKRGEKLEWPVSSV